MVLKDVGGLYVVNKLNARIVKKEVVGGDDIIYAYTDIIPTSIELFDTKVNLQISCSGHKCVVGWPLILGDF